ncbi:DUF397 domain-containing protein [Actinoallomurus sp. CA-150999]
MSQPLAWRKSTWSGTQNECVEVATLDPRTGKE